MVRVLVTGGAGFIGSEIVRLLLDAGVDVAVIDDLSAFKGPDGYSPPEGVAFYQDDLASAHLTGIFRAFQPDYVIHQAAQVSVARSVADPWSDFRINVFGSVRLLEVCRRCRVKKVVFASSAAVYGEPERLPVDEEHPLRPRSPYALAKYVIERYLALYKQLYGLEYTILRYANVYGPGQKAHGGEGGVVAAFLERAASGLPLIVTGDGRQTRDFVFLTDVARANVLALTHGAGQAFNISTNRSVSLLELLQVMEGVLGRPLAREQGPARSGEVRHSVLDNTKARRLLGWQPTVELADGLKKTATAYAT